MPLLFSYGTLQQESVQLSVFGRRLVGQEDELCGFEPGSVRIDDSAAASRLGRSHHANVVFNGDDDSRVPGTAFEVEDAELAHADRFEAEFAYVRIDVLLCSGRRAWVYVHAPDIATLAGRPSRAP